MYNNNIFGTVSSLLLGSMAAPLKPNFTAIGARNGSSTLECWQLDSTFSFSTERGVPGGAAAQLGGLSNVSYTVFPPTYDVGLHNAPFKQWVVFMKGLAYFTLPDDNSTSAYISAGEHGIIFAADTPDVSHKGHQTQLVGMTETIVLFIPTKDGEEPAHEVLHSGPCTADEAGGLGELVLGGSS